MYSKLRLRKTIALATPQLGIVEGVNIQTTTYVCHSLWLTEEDYYPRDTL